jgi:uncharacterized membrane protein YqhA
VTEQTVFWQVVVHLTFVASALLLAWTDRVSLPWPRGPNNTDPAEIVDLPERLALQRR